MQCIGRYLVLLYRKVLFLNYIIITNLFLWRIFNALTFIIASLRAV